jgi:hypothetical protein
MGSGVKCCFSLVWLIENQDHLQGEKRRNQRRKGKPEGGGREWRTKETLMLHMDEI